MKENVELAKKLCRHFLETELVPNEDSENPEVNFKTENDQFFFTQDESAPVMSRRTLRGQHPIEGRFHYTVEVVKCTPSYDRFEPDEYDQVEIGRGESLVDAVKQAILLDLENNIDGYLQNEAEAQFEIESEIYYANLDNFLK